MTDRSRNDPSILSSVARCRRSRLGGLTLLVATVLLVAATASATSEGGTDCSSERPPATPLVMTVDSRPQPLFHVTLGSFGPLDGTNEQPVSIHLNLLDHEEVPRDRYLSLTLLLPPGVALAGRVFRLPENAANATIPGPLPSLSYPEVNRWELSSIPDEMIAADRFTVATARVELGIPRGGVVPGRIRLCIAAGQVMPFEDAMTTPDVVVEGRFEAKLFE